MGHMVERYEGLTDAQGNIAKNTVLRLRHLQKSIEDATVDRYDEEEQASGFLTVIDETPCVAIHYACPRR